MFSHHALYKYTSILLQIPFPESRSIHIMTTHPRILFVLVFLLSAIAKRDPVGRKPRKAVFAKEGLGVLEREGWGDVVGSGGNGGEDEQEGRVEFGMTGPGTREISCGYLVDIYWRLRPETDYMRSSTGICVNTRLGSRPEEDGSDEGRVVE